MNTRLVDNQNMILLDVPAGKHYLTSALPASQKSSKIFTSWYYAFALLRQEVRIGELFLVGSLDTTNDNPAPLMYLKEQRKMEKVISSLRKNATNIHEKMCRLVAEIETGAKDTAELKNILKNSGLTTPNIDIKNILAKATNLAKMRVEQDILKEIVGLYNSTLCTLDPQANVASWYSQLACANQQFKCLPLADKVSSYQRFLAIKIAEKYGLRISSWHPGSGFNSLMAALRQEGLLVVNSGISKYCYQALPTKGKLIENRYQLYYWKAGSKKKEELSAKPFIYPIVICGAESIAIQNGQQDTILFFDPSDESHPNEARPIYRTSFINFCKTLSDINGCFSSSPGQLPAGPFAYCGPAEDMRNTLHQAYQDLVALYVQTVEDCLEQYAQSCDKETSSLHALFDNSLPIITEIKSLSKQVREEINASLTLNFFQELPSIAVEEEEEKTADANLPIAIIKVRNSSPPSLRTLAEKVGQLTQEEPSNTNSGFRTYFFSNLTTSKKDRLAAIFRENLTKNNLSLDPPSLVSSPLKGNFKRSG